jgi:predicted transcriptional regulator
MQDLQGVFTRLRKTKEKQRAINAAYKEALSKTPGYENIASELKTLKEKKRKIEEDVRRDFKNEFNEMDGLKADAETDQELLSDIALNTLVKGETVKVTDDENNNYEPVFSVKFKKVY